MVFVCFFVMLGIWSCELDLLGAADPLPPFRPHPTGDKIALIRSCPCISFRLSLLNSLSSATDSNGLGWLIFPLAPLLLHLLLYLYLLFILLHLMLFIPSVVSFDPQEMPSPTRVPSTGKRTNWTSTVRYL